MDERFFDLNIKQILEGWGIEHAIRELIANALDEQILSKTADIQIFEDERGRWHIRDFGRGLCYEHLTQNENAEKLANPSRVIGKFGVGLKDALATLNRNHIDVQVESSRGHIAIRTAPKHGFADVLTLHAAVTTATDDLLIGTDIIMDGVNLHSVNLAKSFFLRFSGERCLDETQYGQILEKIFGQPARVYVNGLLVAEEGNFVFSYNITSLTSAMRRALNRERSNVGRTAYSDRVKSMLLTSSSNDVMSALAADLAGFEYGTEHDEVRWTDVATHACKILGSQDKILFVTASELVTARDSTDFAVSQGCRIITIPDNIRRTLSGLTDSSGTPLRDLSVLRQEWNQGFEFKFVELNNLSESERIVFERWPSIAKLGGGMPANVKEIKISETMRPDAINGDNIIGLWIPGNPGMIVLKRCRLASVTDLAGTLLHEMVHARSGFSDVSRQFECALTEMLGVVASSRVEIARAPAGTKPEELLAPSEMPQFVQHKNKSSLFSRFKAWFRK